MGLRLRFYPLIIVTHELKMYMKKVKYIDKYTSPYE